VKPWTTLEIEALRYLGPRLGGRESCDALQRSYESVRCQAWRLGIRLRKTCDAKMTQLNGSLLHEVSRLAHAPLCPACGKRYVTVPSTGMCGPCHVERRVALHQQHIDEQEAQRELWAARSKLQRRRRALIRVRGS